MVDQLSQAGTPPVTLPKVHQSPLPGQVAIAITCHRRRLEVLQCLDISGFTIRHSRCLLCRYKPEIEFRHGTRRRCQLRQRGNMGLRRMDTRPATRSVNADSDWCTGSGKYRFCHRHCSMRRVPALLRRPVLHQRRREGTSPETLHLSVSIATRRGIYKDSVLRVAIN